ncbi:MAG: sulfatase-like hydrolase/transferase [Planctomycetota bacterium]
MATPSLRQLVLLACPWLWATFAPPAAAQGGAPNILLVHVDDVGWVDHSLALDGAAPPEGRPFRTPHLERLAREGTLFTHAYASAPVCSPTRVSLMTGQHPARHGVTYWTLHAGRDTSAPFPTLSPPRWRSDSLQPGDVTLPGVLRDAGYHTIHVGKAHFGARGTPGEDPCALGFDVNIGGHAAGGPGSFLARDHFSASRRTRGGDTVWDVPGLAAYFDEDMYLTDVLAAEAARALEAGLRARRASGRPVFLQFAPYAVHAPITANERVADRIPAALREGLDPRERAYATMVASVDDALGALLAVLDREGAAEDTLVVYTSDNGGLSAHGRGGVAHTHNAPLASGKGSALEGGVRVPLVVRWPGHVRPGGVSAVTTLTHDLFPTLLGAAHATAPAGHAVDGRSLWAALEHEAGASAPGTGGGAHVQATDERILWWHMPHYWGVRGPGIEPYSALTRGDWKLIHYHSAAPLGAASTSVDPRAGRLALYDLGHDPGEADDLAAREPARVRELAALLAERQRAALVGMSRLKATGEPVFDALQTYEALAAPR